MNVAYLSKFLTINLDLSVTVLCIKKLKFLAYIHPNVITCFGIALNFIILQQSHNPNIIFYLCLALRYLADCLDGGVAREYGKSSRLGGFLDTASDNILIFIVVFSLWGNDQVVYAFTTALFFYHPEFNCYVLPWSLNRSFEHEAKFSSNQKSLRILRE